MIRHRHLEPDVARDLTRRGILCALAFVVIRFVLPACLEFAAGR